MYVDMGRRGVRTGRLELSLKSNLLMCKSASGKLLYSTGATESTGNLVPCGDLEGGDGGEGGRSKR